MMLSSLAQECQRKRHRLLPAGALALALHTVIGAPAASQASAPTPEFVSAPRNATVGQSVTIAARGLRTAEEAGRARRDFNYRLTFTRLAGTGGLDCVRTIDRPYVGVSRFRTYEWSGRVPQTLRCYDRGRYIREIPVRNATYRWVVGVKSGKAAWDREASVLVRGVRVRRG